MKTTLAALIAAVLLLPALAWAGAQRSDWSVERARVQRETRQAFRDASRARARAFADMRRAFEDDRRALRNRLRDEMRSMREAARERQRAMREHYRVHRGWI